MAFLLWTQLFLSLLVAGVYSYTATAALELKAEKLLLLNLLHPWQGWNDSLHKDLIKNALAGDN